MTAGVQMNVVVPVAFGVGVAIASCALIRKFRKIRWQAGGQVKGLFIYPFKSLPPLEVPTAELTVQGLQYMGVKDREFLLLDADNEMKFISARSEPSLLLIDVQFNKVTGCLELTSKKEGKTMNLLEIPVGPGRGVDPSAILHVNTWERNGPYAANPCDQRVQDWFSTYLDKNVCVVRLIGLTKPRSRDCPDRFQDTAVLNILSERSVENLVELIKDPSANITFRNFRPSILVTTKYPHEEDFWARVRIANAETEFHSRCHRCILTTINPDTGVKTEKEPLVTLRKFRVDRSTEGVTKYNYQPLFSSHHIIRSPGTIRVGDTMLVEKAARELL